VNTQPLTSADSWGAYWDIPPKYKCVGEAREVTRKTLAEWGLESLGDTVSLLVSELVTNAVVHAGTPIRFALHRYGDAVRGEVSDRGAALPEVRHADEDAEGGRGLEIVTLFADAWGVELPEDGPGKTVWFECRVGGR
jgi:anti-sigma regulatory factor (Ser/Thr protein kinase)